MHTSTIHEMNSGTIRPGVQASHTKPLAARGSLRHTVTMLAFTLIAALSAKPLAAQVPAIVATSETTIASGFSAGPAVTDSCGDVYVYEGGGTGIVEIQAGTGNVITVIANAQGYPSGGQALYMDAAKKNLYFPDFGNFYTTHFDQVPIVNCLAGTINNTFASNLYSLPNPNYYWGTAQDIAGDAAGDVFFTTTANVQSAIYEEIFNASANTYTAAQILQSWPNNVIHIAADAAGDVFFNDGTANIYELKTPYTTAPTTPFTTGFNSVAGLSLDPQGNLYIADSGTSLVYEIPNESGTLNPAHQYAVAAVGVVFKVGVDAFHNLYLSNYYPGAAEIKTGSAVAPSTAVGSVSGTFPITYVFNTSVTPTAITASTGTSPSTTFSPGAGGCAVGTAYAALSSCSVNATYTPSAVGEQTGAITLTGSAGTVTTFVSGIGQGAAATIDPGTVNPSTTTLTAPTGVAVDNLGNVFVTDTKANTLTEFAAGGGGVGTTVSTGTLTLSAPQGVAVDAIGDIFIADTGNNRVVEIPVVNGVLTNASTAALSPVLKQPEGVAVDGAGNLYIADTGDNNLLVVPNLNGTLDFAAAQSYGASLSAPSAVTVDPIGNVFVAETGNNDVLEFPEPIGSAAQVKVASSLTGPTSLATDASGSLFVVDSGSESIFRYPNVGGNLGARTLAGSTVANPIGVATDASGNLYVTDTTDQLTVEVQRVTAALNFGGWNVGTTSTPLTGTISSSGNESLIFQSPSYTAGGNTSAGFAVTSDGCAGQSELPGGSCAITATFTPPAPELNAEEDLTLASNAANGSPVLQLIGTGAHITPSTLSLALTAPAGNPTLNAGESVTFTATIGTGGATATPGGSVKFFVNGTQVGTVAVSGGAASITLKNGLPAGNNVIVSADYTGDVINYSGSTAQITEVVIALPDTLTLAVNAPYNNPLSANDNSANAKGPAIPLVATLVPSSTAIPGGTVTFYAGTTTLGVASVLPASGGAFQATLNTTALRAGTTTLVENDSFETNYNISAVYSGDTSYYPATSNTVAISIVGANPTANPANPNTTGATFTITPANPTITATTTTAGGPASGSTTLTINSYGGWNGVLNFTCSGLPAYATCNPFPGFPTGVPSTPGATVPPTAVDFIINTNVAPIVPTGSSMTWWISGIAGFLLLVLRRRVKQSGYLRAGQLLTVLAAVLLLTGSAIGISGCSSSGYPFVTPAGSSTVTVKVSAAQLVPGTTTGNTEPVDINVPSFQITLIVK